jgi:hypothetical protein
MRNLDGARYEGFGEWADLSEALMRALSHGLTNRISSINSFVQLQSMGDTEFSVESFLPKETDQLQRLARGLRQLVIDGESSAIELLPLLNDAIELYGHHARMHTMRCELSVDAESMLPIRVVRSAMLRLLVILLDMAAVEVQEAGESAVPVRVTANEQELTLYFGYTRAPSEYAMALAESSGASLSTGESGCELAIPTLLALRARA